MSDLHKVYAVLHKMLLDMESRQASLRIFDDLDTEQCRKAHDILTHLGSLAKAAAEKDQTPS